MKRGNIDNNNPEEYTNRLTTGEALDLMIECLPLIEKIRMSDTAKTEIAKGKKPDPMYLMIGENREHMYKLLSKIIGKTEEEIDAQGFIKTYNDMTRAMNGEFFAFFTLLSRMAASK